MTQPNRIGLRPVGLKGEKTVGLCRYVYRTSNVRQLAIQRRQRRRTQQVRTANNY